MLSGSDYLDSTNMLVGPTTGFDIKKLREAYFKICDNDGLPTALMSSARALRMFEDACDDTNRWPQQVMSVWNDPIAGTRRAPRTAFHGTPWYINDMIPENDTERVWIMVLGDQDAPGPGHGVTGIIPAANQGRKFTVRRSTPNSQYIVVDVTMAAGFALGSQGALAAYDFTVPT